MSLELDAQLINRSIFSDLLINDAFCSINEQWLSRDCLGVPTVKTSHKIKGLMVGCEKSVCSY
jgi:hypothetical protein